MLPTKNQDHFILYYDRQMGDPIKRFSRVPNVKSVSLGGRGISHPYYVRYHKDTPVEWNVPHDYEVAA